MPLSKLQSDLLRLLAANRDPESYVGGSTPLNWNASRFSGDIDFFHDREERVARAAEEDAAILKGHGYVLEWFRREPAFFRFLSARAMKSQNWNGFLIATSGFFPP